MKGSWQGFLRPLEARRSLNTVTTLPIAPQSFWLVAGLTGTVLLSLLLYGLLSRMDRDHRPPVWEELREGWGGLTILLGLLWLGLFALTIAAAYVGVWTAIHPKDAASQPGLGLGALLAALLGAPFVIWGTWLKYQTVRYQKEGHITDRINKAVEQLGAEKKVDRIGRPVTLQSGHPDLVHPDEIEFRTVIEWQGMPLQKRDDEFEQKFGEWTNFSETVPNIEVRIGAILSLERIAQDSTIHDKGRDHVRVMEILCAYVRENSNARKPVDYPEPEWVPLKDEATQEEWKAHLAAREERFGGSIYQSNAWAWAQGLSKPRDDVMQALKVIGRRTAAQRRVEAAWPDVPDQATVWPFDVPCPRLTDDWGDSALTTKALAIFRKKLGTWRDAIRAYKGYRLGLQGANLQGANLAPQRSDGSDAVFAGALLQGARIEGADLSGARMEGANLKRARAEAAKLAQVRMQGADLWRAKMERADLSRARMEGAHLSRAQMEGVYAWGAYLTKADLSEARLEAADLTRAQMEASDLWGARLEGARLQEARMEGARLQEARIEGTILSNAWMDAADLFDLQADASTCWIDASVKGAAVRFAHLLDTPISAEQVNATFGDGTTTLPAAMPRPPHWPTAELDFLQFQAEWAKWRDDPAGYQPPMPKDGSQE